MIKAQQEKNAEKKARKAEMKDESTNSDTDVSFTEHAKERDLNKCPKEEGKVSKKASKG